jgi:hypothetical protein
MPEAADVMVSIAREELAHLTVRPFDELTNCRHTQRNWLLVMARNLPIQSITTVLHRLNIGLLCKLLGADGWVYIIEFM